MLNGTLVTHFSPVIATIPISSMIPVTIPRWSRFATFISVLISASSFLLLGNYFILPLRAECGLEYLSERNWSSQSKGVEVNLCNEQEEILASYLATNGS